MNARRKNDMTAAPQAALAPAAHENTCAREVLCCDAADAVVRVSWTLTDAEGHDAAYAFTAYEFSRARRSSERFAPAVEYVRDAAGGRYDALSCICCNIGPGSFTGLRNCLAFVKGLVAAQEIAPYAAGVREHDMVAHAHALRDMRATGQQTDRHAAPLLVCTDARSGRYYAALYDCAHSPQKDLEEYLPEYLAEYFRATIDDLSAEEIAPKILGKALSARIIRVAGSAAEKIAPQLAGLARGCGIQLLPALSSEEMLRSLKTIGLYYREKNMSPITELSEPLYVRGAV